MAQYGIIMPQAPAHFTHPRLHIRTAQDAHRVFEAVRLGILPLIRRRLSPSERDLLASGQVFVWEEAPTGSAAGDEASATTSGLERWTDGRRWSQSRMREPFLFYEEKVQTTPEEKQAKAERRARKASSSDSTNVPSLLPIRRQDRPSKPDGLTKQTYSSFVHLPPSSQSDPSLGGPNAQPRKWHCVAYFSAADWNNLPGVEAYADLRNIVIPDNIYTSTKGTGKTGAPLAMGTPSSSASDAGGSSVGPTRRPLSRGEHGTSPYSAGASGSTPTLRARQYSFGSSSDASSSYQPRSPSSAYESPASYSYQSPPPVPALPPSHQHQHQHHQQQQQKQLFHPHHQHTSSTSSNSTGSPPTPGFMAPIPSPASFTNQSPSYPSTARPFPESRKSFGASSSSGYNDVVMADAPTLRTPTKEHPPQSHHNDYESRNGERNGYFTNGSSAHVSATPTQQTGGNTKLPSLPSLLGQNWSSSSSGRSREDSRALGAFRLAL